MSAIDVALSRRRILITCGTGGVGKTTLSAAVALRAALAGRRAVVVTIDPAKRLATSLGIGALGDEPTDLTERVKRIAAERGEDASRVGSLHAIVPDTRRTFERFVDSLARDEATARRVKDNPIFQIFAREFSGTNEYMALQRLDALARDPSYDCIIVDTPPSRNALAFLDAPKLLARFFEEKLIKWLVLPANRLFAGGMRKALGVLEGLTGAAFIRHLLEFASALFEVRAAFTESLARITDLLRSPETGFLLVTTPTPDTVPEALHLIETLDAKGFRFDGVVLNRTLGYFEISEDERRIAEEEARRGDPGLKGALALVAALQARERRVAESLVSRLPLSARLPELARDVHSLEDLVHVALALRASGT